VRNTPVTPGHRHAIPHRDAEATVSSEKETAAMKITKKVLVLGLSGALAISAAGAVMAQDPARGGESGRPGKAHVLKAGLNSLSEITGIDRQVFKDGFKAGKSINQVLIENGKDPAAVQAELLAKVRERLDQAVAGGNVSQEKADTAYARAEKAIPRMMERVPDGNGRPGRGMRRPTG
jgi:hypothetical protein